jgi:hypothetical protein
MFLTSIVLEKQNPTEPYTNLIEELDMTNSKEWLKIYTFYKNCVDANHILNYAREGFNTETAVHCSNFYSTTLENAINFQNAFDTSGLIDFYSSDGYNVTVLAPVEIDIEDHSNRPIDYTEEGWIEEFISEETGRMWGVQFPVT